MHVRTLHITAKASSMITRGLIGSPKSPRRSPNQVSFEDSPRTRESESRIRNSPRRRKSGPENWSIVSGELEHRTEGFDLRVLAHVERSRDDSRGGGGRARERIKMLPPPISRTASGNSVVMEDWVLGAIKVRVGVCLFVMCARWLFHNDSFV